MIRAVLKRDKEREIEKREENPSFASRTVVEQPSRSHSHRNHRFLLLTAVARSNNVAEMWLQPKGTRVLVCMCARRGESGRHSEAEAIGSAG